MRNQGGLTNKGAVDIESCLRWLNVLHAQARPLLFLNTAIAFVAIDETRVRPVDRL